MILIVKFYVNTNLIPFIPLSKRQHSTYLEDILFGEGEIFLRRALPLLDSRIDSFSPEGEREEILERRRSPFS